ncbi:unnamed protein product [Cylindrotheca closterium]|nr:unnamed protein product [Cylindrotheca closterium]
MSPKCPDRLLQKTQWKNQDQYVDYGKKLNLNQIGATVPATVPAIVPGASQVEHQLLREALHHLCNMEIKNAKFVTCIDTTVRYRSCIPVQNLKTDPVFEALDKIFRRYNKAGFQVKIIKCDRAFIPRSHE